MNDLLERLEGMGQTCGFLALALSAALLAATFGLAWASTDGFTTYEALLSNPEPDAIEGTLNAYWRYRAFAFGAAFTLVMALGPLFVGLQLVTQTNYPSAAETFPPLPVPEIEAALRNRTEAQSVCTRCHVMVPTAFSTGSCPVCASSVESHDDRDDEDIGIVVAAMS